MAQKTRRRETDQTATPDQATTPDQEAMAQELYGRPYADLAADETEAVNISITRAQENPGEAVDPTSGNAVESGESSANSGDADSGPNAENGEVATVTTTQVRAWALENPGRFQGVPTHGRLTEEIKSAYLTDHPGAKIVSPDGKKASKPLVPVPVDALKFEEVPENEWDSHPLSDGPAPRDPVQIRFDDRVKALYDKWVEAGKPEIRRAPRDRIAVEQQYGPAVRRMLGSAGTHHKILVKVQPVSHDQNGRQVIVFTAVDRPAKPGTETAPTQETAPTPKPAPAE